MHGAIERGGVVEAREGMEGQLGGDAGDQVGEGGRGAERGLRRLGEGEREAVGPRDERGAGGGEGGEEGGCRGGELAVGGGLGHAERLLGAGRREAEAGGDGGDGGGGAGELLVAVGGVGGVADEAGDAEVEAARVGEGGLVDELRRAGVVDDAAGGADEHAGVRVRDHRALAARQACGSHRGRGWRARRRGPAAACGGRKGVGRGDSIGSRGDLLRISGASTACMGASTDFYVRTAQDGLKIRFICDVFETLKFMPPLGPSFAP